MNRKAAAARTKVTSIIQAASPANDWQRYEGELLDCFQDDPDFDGLHFALANVCRTHGKLVQAEKYLLRSLELQDSGFRGLNLILLGEILVGLRRLEEAETAFAGALAHNFAPLARDGVMRQLEAVQRSLIATPDGGIKCQPADRDSG